MKKIKTALISVYDKKNLKLLLKNLSKHKIQIISSGGTFKEIKKLGYKCLEVSKYTGFSTTTWTTWLGGGGGTWIHMP